MKKFSVATGRHAMYSAREDERLLMLMERLRESYAEGGERSAEITRRVVRTEEEIRSRK